MTRSSTGNMGSGRGAEPPLQHLRQGTGEGFKPSLFIRLFQEGVFTRTIVGKTLMDFLTGDLGIDVSYIMGRISTIFLNGVPVEDLQCAHIAKGSVIALSAAMPGLVGSILRRGGHLAAMRTPISAKWTSQEAGLPVWVKIKLFNALVPELGPLLLKKGIWVRTSALQGEEGLSRMERTSLGPDSGFDGEEIIFLPISQPLNFQSSNAP